MIIFLSGTVLHKNEKSLALLTGMGIGYEVFVSPSFLPEISVSQEIQMFIVTHVRENEIALYGFSSMDQRNLFLKLLTFKGIGPKLSLEILSLPPQLLYEAITNDDPALLTHIKGLGQKTAERLVFEFKRSSLENFFENMTLPPLPRGGVAQEAESALINLGYDRVLIREFLKKSPPELKTVEALIKWFLTSSPS